MPSPSLALQLVVNDSSEEELEAVQRSLDSNEAPKEASAFFVKCQKLRLLLVVPSEEAELGEASSRHHADSPRYAAIFVPSTLVQAAVNESGLSDKVSLDTPPLTTLSVSDRDRLSPALLQKILPVFSDFGLPLILVAHVKDTDSHNPSDVLLLDLRDASVDTVNELLQATSCQTVRDTAPGVNEGGSDHTPTTTATPLVLKVVPISRLDLVTTNSSTSLDNQHRMDIPHCPVCLHRIDPLQLGLSRPRNQDLCSNFCPPPSLIGTGSHDECSCPRQQLLRPWPDPSHCPACHVIQSYWWRRHSSSSVDQERHDLFCCQCAMQETLWVCLSCGFVGCGRYSNKHAAEHYTTTRHAFSLELATLRIWNYVSGDFVHRVDLLECPSSPPRLLPWMQQVPLSSPESPVQHGSTGSSAGLSSSLASPDQPPSSTHAMLPSDSESTNNSLQMPSMLTAADTEKSPKKATMIGQEYEALLQSALEEQTQHYEGEIIRLRAQLTAENLDNAETMTKEQAEEVACLREEVASLRTEIDRCSRDLVDLQAQEAGHRSTSQLLLREQQVSEDLLKKIQEEAANEHAQGRMQMDEMEQQIADLTANQRMRREFVNNDELLNAQIFGTTSTIEQHKSSNRKGKKGRRFFRK